MQRRWRPFRLLLAGPVFVLALISYVYWPAQVVSKIPRKPKEHLLGFRTDSVEAISVSQFPFGCLGHNGMFIHQGSHPNGDFNLSIDTINFGTCERAQLCTVSCQADRWSTFQLSTQGNLLALIQSHMCTLIDLEKKVPILGIQSGEGTVCAAFSSNEKILALLTINKVSVWNISDRCCIAEFKCPQSGEFNKTFGVDSAMLPEHRYSHMNFNRESNLLAVARRGKIAVYDLIMNRCIGEVNGEGQVHFLNDGSLAVSNYYLNPEQPLVSHFRIHPNNIEKISDGNAKKKTDDRGISQLGRLYLTSSYRSGKVQAPSWMPSKLTNILQAYWPTSAPHWIVSVRDLQDEHPQKHFHVPVCDEKIYHDRFCGMCPVNPSMVDFKALASTDNCWLLLEDRMNIELWPLLTWWRPESCWLTVIVFFLISLYLFLSGRGRIRNYQQCQEPTARRF